MAGGPLENLHADRCVRARIAEHADSEADELSVGVTTCFVLHADGVALGVHEERLLARERGLDRTVEQPRRQGGLALVRHVFLTAERAAIADEFGEDQRLVDVENASNIVAVVPDALATGVDVQTAFVRGLRRVAHRSSCG